MRVAFTRPFHPLDAVTLSTTKWRQAMKWTTEKPTRDGWYWCRNINRECVSVIQIDNLCFYDHDYESVFSLDDIDTNVWFEWSDQPIPEPTEAGKE